MEYKLCEQCGECLECHGGVILAGGEEKITCSCKDCGNMYIYNVQDSEMEYEIYDDDEI